MAVLGQYANRMRIMIGTPLPALARRCVFAIVLAALPAASWAQPPAPTPCAIPDDLVLRDVRLPAAREAMARDKVLTILTLGGAHTAGDTAEGKSATYPARLEAQLATDLPGVRVSVVNEAVPNQTARDMAPRLPGLIEKTGARLVIWAPGGRDVALQLDPAAFRDAIAAGIAASRRGGADLILIDPTFVPSPARMASIGPYRDRLRGAASAAWVPLLPRHEMMLRWSKDGTLNLEARDPAEQTRVARALFACVARSLAVPIAAALR